MGATFKENSKRELLAALPSGECCKAAFLSALFKVSGTLEGTGRRQTLNLRLDTYEAARKISDMLQSIYPVECPITAPDSERGGFDKEKRTYKVTIPQGFAKQALIDFELMSVNGEGLMNFTRGLPQQLLTKQCCMKAYFQGLYLGCGGAYAPVAGEEKKQGYHFELQFYDEEFADGVMELLSDLRIKTRMSDRNGGKLIYVKDKDEIVSILCILGLGDSAKRLQTVIDERETANELNRAIICETANMDKTFAASTRLVIAIAKLKTRDEFEKLSLSLRDTAEARAQYPEASMQELADMLGVTKSCLHHRLKKIEALAYCDE